MTKNKRVIRNLKKKQLKKKSFELRWRKFRQDKHVDSTAKLTEKEINTKIWR